LIENQRAMSSVEFAIIGTYAEEYVSPGWCWSMTLSKRCSFNLHWNCLVKATITHYVA